MGRIRIRIRNSYKFVAGSGINHSETTHTAINTKKHGKDKKMCIQLTWG